MRHASLTSLSAANFLKQQEVVFAGVPSSGYEFDPRAESFCLAGQSHQRALGKINELQQEITQLNGRIKSLESQNLVLRQNAFKEATEATYQRQIDELNRENDALRLSNELHKQVLAQRDIQLTSLENAQQILKQASEGEAQQNGMLKGEIAQLNEELMRERANTALMNDEHRQRNCQLERAWEERNRQSQRALEEKANELENVQKENRIFKEKNQALQEEVYFKCEIIDENTSEIAKLEQQISEFCFSNRRQQQNAYELDQSQFKQLRKDTSNLRDILQTGQAVMSKQLTGLQAKLQQLGEQYSMVNKRHCDTIARLEASVQAGLAGRVELEQEKEELQKDMALLSARVAVEETKIEDHKQDTQMADTQLLELQRENARLNELLGESQEIISKLQNQLELKRLVQ